MNKRFWLIAAAVFVAGIAIGAVFMGGGEAPAPAGDTAAAEHVSEAGEGTIWTCSMHPQIRLPEPGKCPICFMDLIPLENDDNNGAATQLTMSADAMKLAEVTTAPVTRGFAATTVRTVGKVMVDERRLKKITAWVGGRLDRLYVDFTGVAVRKGEPLVEIYSPELYSAQVELIEAAKVRRDLANSGAGLVRRTAGATVDAAREKLQLLGLEDDQITRIESSEKPDEHMVIHAPVGGIVVHKKALEGDYVKTGSPIYTIAELSRVWIMMDIYESDLVWVKNGEKVEFEVEAFPGVAFEGRIAFIDPVVNPKTRTVKVRVDAENPGLRLKPEMFVHAVIHSELATEQVDAATGHESAEPPLLIPATAPLITGKRAVVYVKVPDTEKPTFEGREVVLGPKAGDSYVVLSGLGEGEQVVVKGNFKIDSAMQIQAKPSMMSPAGGAPAPAHRHGGATESGGGASHEASGMGADTSADEGAGTGAADLTVPRATIAGDLAPVATTLAGPAGPVYHAYFELQKALAADDTDAAGAAAGTLRDALLRLEAASPGGIAGAALDEWVGAAVAAAEAVPGRDITDIRRALSRLTDILVILEKAVGPPAGVEHYLLFCPMAFDNQGATWLQTDADVHNPYFGKSMLKCGTVREIFGAPDDGEDGSREERKDR